MKFIHIVTIEQLPDGSTKLTQETRKEGEGEPSEQMKFEVARYYEAFSEYFVRYKSNREISVKPNYLPWNST